QTPDELPGSAVAKRGGGKEQTGQQLHPGVAHRDGRPTGPAASPEGKPGQERDVLVPGEHVPAFRAMRPRTDDRLTRRESGDHYVEETPHHEPPHEGNP